MIDTRHYGPGPHPGTGTPQSAHHGLVDDGVIVYPAGTYAPDTPAGAASDWSVPTAPADVESPERQSALEDLVYGPDLGRGTDWGVEEQKVRAAMTVAAEIASPEARRAISESPGLGQFLDKGGSLMLPAIMRGVQQLRDEGLTGEALTSHPVYVRAQDLVHKLRGDWTALSVEQRYEYLGDRLVREAIAAGYIAQWASTASDNTAQSLLVQKAAAAEFGLSSDVVTEHGEYSGGHFHYKGAALKYVDPEAVAREVEDIWATSEPGYRALVRATYTATQRALADAGIAEVTVTRGVGTAPSFVPRKQDVFGHPARIPDWSSRRTGVVTLNPLSSWSTDHSVARAFGEVLLGSTVPASRVFSFSATGPSCREEWEIILTGGDINVEGEDNAR